MTNDPLTEFYGEPIYTRTSDQDIEDGVLHHPYPDKFPGLYISDGVLVKLTKGLIDKYEKWDSLKFDQRCIPMLMDCSWAIKAALLKDQEETLVILEHTAAGTIWMGPNEKGGWTVHFPSEH